MSDEDDDSFGVSSPHDLRMTLRRQSDKSAPTPNEDGAYITSEENLWRIVHGFGSQMARSQTLSLLKCRLLARIADNQERLIQLETAKVNIMEREEERQRGR